MGLRSEIQEAIGEAFDNDLADAVTAFTLRRLTGSTYNTETGETTPTYTTATGRGVFYEKKVTVPMSGYDYLNYARKIQDIQETEPRLIVLLSELSDFLAEDEITNTATGEVFIVSAPSTDPVDAVADLKLRRITDSE